MPWPAAGAPWQGLRQAGSVGRAGRPQARAPAGAGWQGVGGRGRVGSREKWLYFSYTRDEWRSVGARKLNIGVFRSSRLRLSPCTVSEW